MAFVFYDVETTGLNKRFDQILQFAAVRTDVNLVKLEKIETKSRLMPQIIPSPKALHLTGTSLAEVTNPSRQSHYSMVCEIAHTLSAWSPATFLGFNSISFDEEFLRQAFYQCLHPIFLTNTKPNLRADVLNLMRAAGTLYPLILRPGAGANGEETYRLAALASANGILSEKAHDAKSDVETMIELCRLVRDGAPELWSIFLRFSSKTSVVDFITSEEAFAYFDYYGSPSFMHFLTRIDVSPLDGNVHYCLDLSTDIDRLRGLDDPQLIERIGIEPRPIRKVRANRSPLLYALWDIEEPLFGNTSEEELIRSASDVRNDSAFVRRLTAAAAASEAKYPTSEHVELQIYGAGFYSDSDRELCERFHQQSWEGRIRLIDQFNDHRLRRLSKRLIYFEAPHLFKEAERHAIDGDIDDRRRGVGRYESAPWTTLATATSELESIDGKSNDLGKEFGKFLAGA